MLAEAKMSLPMLRQQAAAAAGPEGVRRVIGARFALYPPPTLSPPEWAAWWASYFDVLADLPEPALEAAMSAYIRDPKAEFMPKPGKLRALALETPNMAVRAYDRARKAVEASRPAAPMGPRADVEDVKRMLEEYRERLPKKPERAEIPPFVAETDGTGLTLAMRELMGIPDADDPIRGGAA